MKPLVCGVLLCLAAINVHAGNAASRAVPVRVATAQMMELASGRWLSGAVISSDDAEIAAEVEGRVEFVVEIGAEVGAGEVVARIDSVTLALALEEAGAESAATEARLKFFDAEVGRLTLLAEQNNAAQQALEQAVSQRDQASGELAMHRARLARARNDLDRSTVGAPFGGVIAERFKETGEWADVGHSLLRLVNTERREIRGEAPHLSAALLNVGDSLKVSDGREQVTATIKTLIPVGDEFSRLYQIRMDFEQPQWRAGHAVRFWAPTAHARSVLTVPRDALVIRADAIRVFRVLDDDTVEVVPVQIGEADGQFIEVIGALNAGDRVVIRGNERLRPQQRITIQ